MIKSIVMDKKELAVPCIDMPADVAVIGQVVGDLLATAKKYGVKKCAGLAANQIGYNYRAFVVLHNGYYIPMVNPQFVRLWGGKKHDVEGCLSVPGKIVKIVRHKRVKIRFYDVVTDKVITRNFSDFNARVVQHEMDHLIGKIIG